MALIHSTRTDDAYMYLRQRIIEGKLPFGSRLLINDLAEETGFSTTPIRESLAKLEMYGLVESIPHRGVFVVKPCKRELLEMVEARLCLELFMAIAVIKNVTEDDFPRLRQACVDAAKARPKMELFFEEGLHGVFSRLAGNMFMERLYQRVMSLLNVLYIQGMRSCEDANWIQEYRERHQSEEVHIVDAIEARDLARLQEAITTHITNFRDFLLTTLEKWRPNGLNWNEQEEAEAFVRG